MSINKPWYKIGDTIICTTVPESCLITHIDKAYETYYVKWLLQSDTGLNLSNDRVSYFVGHKYFKKIEDVELEDLRWRYSE